MGRVMPEKRFRVYSMIVTPRQPETIDEGRVFEIHLCSDSAASAKRAVLRYFDGIVYSGPHVDPTRDSESSCQKGSKNRARKQIGRV
jgi:hypothetical protein